MYTKFSDDNQCRKSPNVSLNPLTSPITLHCPFPPPVISQCHHLSPLATTRLAFVAKAAFLHDAFLRPFHAHFNVIVNTVNDLGSKSASFAVAYSTLILLSCWSDQVEKHSFEISRDQTTQAMFASKLTRVATTFP